MNADMHSLNQFKILLVPSTRKRYAAARRAMERLGIVQDVMEVLAPASKGAAVRDPGSIGPEGGLVIRRVDGMVAYAAKVSYGMEFVWKREGGAMVPVMMALQDLEGSRGKGESNG